jgi:hypothetical protein
VFTAPVDPDVAQETPIIKNLLEMAAATPVGPQRDYQGGTVIAYAANKLLIYLRSKDHNFVGCVVSKIAEYWPDRQRVCTAGAQSLDTSLAVALGHIAPGNHPAGFTAWVVSTATRVDPAVGGSKKARIALVQTIRDGAAHMDAMEATLRVIQEVAVLSTRTLRSGRNTFRRVGAPADLFGLTPTGHLTRATSKVVVIVPPCTEVWSLPTAPPIGVDCRVYDVVMCPEEMTATAIPHDDGADSRNACDSDDESLYDDYDDCGDSEDEWFEVKRRALHAELGLDW